MIMRNPVLTWLAVAGLALAPALATSNHHYGKGEYAIIRHGLAPNRQVSLASHGGGELGDENFQLWLMAEPAHRKIMAVDNISSDNNLDTDPDAYHAVWSKDSRHVGVAFRSSRHEVTLNLYRVENRRIHLLGGPDLFKEVTHRDVADQDDVRQSTAMVEWHDGNRFTLREYRSFVADDDSLAKLFGAHGRVAEKLPEGKLFIEFFVNAECEMAPGDRYKVIGIAPGNPGDAETWGEQ
jgi:hypothetical protein